jgi:hypothetical protein
MLEWKARLLTVLVMFAGFWEHISGVHNWNW